MHIKNIESGFNNDELYYCFSPTLKRYLTIKNIIFINKGTDKNTKQKYWVYLKTNHLLDLIKEFDNEK